jgi:hypothetical protein
MRREGLFSLSSAATPTRQGRRPFRPGPRFNSWERGIAGEHRPDGSFMPYVSETGRRIRLKEWGETRSLREIRERQLSAPT